MTGMNSNIPLNLKLIKIWTDPFQYKQDDRKKVREFLQNFFTNNNSTQTTNIKIVHIDNENVLERNLSI